MSATSLGLLAHFDSLAKLSDVDGLAEGGERRAARNGTVLFVVYLGSGHRGDDAPISGVLV